MSSSYSTVPDWVMLHRTGAISLCVDLFVYIYVYFVCVFFHTEYLLYYCEHDVVDLMGLKPNP